MKFATFSEYNHKEKCSYMHFLQYDGNEYELSSLKQQIELAYFECLSGDFSEFTLDIKNLVSEETVNEMSKVIIDRYNTTMYVCRGKFDFFEEEFVDKDPNQIAILLDDMFYDCQIVKYFIN